MVANVHNQVALALKKYGKRVQSGALTVVGAVFDFRDDLRQGPGKFSIVDVNGNGEAERMEAFMSAINEEGKGTKRQGKGRGVDAAEEALRSLSQVQGIVTREVAAMSNDSPSDAHGHAEH